MTSTATKGSNPGENTSQVTLATNATVLSNRYKLYLIRLTSASPAKAFGATLAAEEEHYANIDMKTAEIEVHLLTRVIESRPVIPAFITRDHSLGVTIKST